LRLHRNESRRASAKARSRGAEAAFADRLGPMAYMRDVLSRLPRMTNQDDLGALAPARWQPAATLVWSEITLRIHKRHSFDA
jgi:hypothetical protein